jgi:hypothetical protein
MSTILAATLIVNFILFALPQNPVSSETPDTLVVVKASWEKQSFRPGWDEAQNSASDTPGATSTSAAPPDSVLNSNGTQGPPPTTPRGPERREPRNNRPDPRVTESVSAVSGPTDRVNKYLYQIKVLNSGSKTVAAIDWEYQFSTGDLEPSRHRFQSFKNIKPDSSSTLTGTSAVPPTRIINASKTSDLSSRVVVHCVLYSDGTASWRAGRSEADCQPIRSRREDR